MYGPVKLDQKFPISKHSIFQDQEFVSKHSQKTSKKKSRSASQIHF